MILFKMSFVFENYGYNFRLLGESLFYLDSTDQGSIAPNLVFRPQTPG